MLKTAHKMLTLTIDYPTKVSFMGKFAMKTYADGRKLM